MTYSANTTDRELVCYYVKGEYVDGAEEFPLEIASYEEREGWATYYSEVTYYFTDADGEEYTWNSEAEMEEWMEENGYTNEY